MTAGPCSAAADGRPGSRSVRGSDPPDKERRRPAENWGAVGAEIGRMVAASAAVVEVRP